MKPNERFQQAFGDVPESFSYRVQYALRQTQKEEQPVKKFSIRTAIVTVLLVALVTAAVAATLSGTIDIFGHLYGERFIQEIEQGKVSPGGQSATLNGANYTLNETVVIPSETAYVGLEEERPADFQPEATFDFYVTGSISAADENLVIMAWDDYTVNDPVGDAVYYGNLYPHVPEGTPTYAELAKQKGLDRVRMVTCIPNGILDAEGKVITNTVAYTVIPMADGTVQFTGEIPMETALAQQATYQMSLYIATQDVDLEGNVIEGTRQSTDWIITVIPE